MKDDPLDVFRSWSELELLTGLIFGESRGEPQAGKVGVGLTVQTRVAHPGHWNWGYNWREVILCPEQFSCFNLSDPNFNIIIEAKQSKPSPWQECAIVAEQIYLGRISSFIGHPTHYHEVDCHPKWAEKLRKLKVVNKLVFYTCFED